MLHCLFIVVDGFFVIASLFIDISEAVVGVAVTGVDFDGLLIPFDGFFNLFLSLVDARCVVVG